MERGAILVKKSDSEISIVASYGENSLLFCECKWTNEPVDATVLETLIERFQLFSATTRHYIVFSKSGFTGRDCDLVQNIGRVRLATFSEVI